MKDFSDEIPFVEYNNENETTNKLNANILNNIDAFVFIFDIDNGIPVWINDFFRKKMGFTNQDLKKKSPDEFLELFHPKSLKQFSHRIQHYDEIDDEGTKTVYQLKTKSGSWIHLLTSTRINERNSDGTLKTLLGYAVEVDAKELDRHLRKIKELQSKQGIALSDKLSIRERDIVRLIANGFTDKEISEILKISYHTTKTHRKRIISKLGLKNTAALVKFAVENGIV
jgi:PAS domain S-box-containing protein